MGLVEAGVLKPVLRIASGTSQAIEDSSSSSSSLIGDGKRNLLLELAASTLALQILLYATSAAEELANAVVYRSLDAKASGILSSTPDQTTILIR